MENLKQSPSINQNAIPEVNEFAQNKQFLLSLNERNTPLWKEEVTAFLLGEFSKRPTLQEEYKNFHKYENFSVENLYYFVLEKYGLFLYSSKKKDEHLFAPTLSSLETSADSYGLWKYFPTASAFTEKVRLYAIADNQVRFYWYTTAFLSRGKLSQTVTINLDTIKGAQQDFYGKIYADTRLDAIIDSVVAHELTHVYYTSPNHKRITSIDWTPIWVQDPKSIIEFLAEFSQLMIDSSIIAYWLTVFVQDISIDKDGKVKTLFTWPEVFTYTKAYEVLDMVFAKKGLSLSSMIHIWVNKIDMVRNIVRQLTPDDIESIRQSFITLQKTIVDTIEKAPK